MADRGRVEAEKAAAVTAGKSGEFVSVERGGSASAKKAVGKVEKKFKG